MIVCVMSVSQSGVIKCDVIIVGAGLSGVYQQFAFILSLTVYFRTNCGKELCKEKSSYICLGKTSFHHSPLSA